jgi:hypothetical protein
MEQTNNAPEVQKRPTFLTVLCILTFIGSGLSTVLYLIAVIAFGAISGVLDSVPGFGAMGDAGLAIFAVFFVLAFLSLFGAIMMWKLKKTGFYLYTAANIIALILPFVLFSGVPVNIFGIIITVGFIAMYAANLKAMK